MPGKVNPVMVESLMQVCVQVIGLDTATAIAGSQGNFELNTLMPLIGLNLLQSAQWLARSIEGFTKVIRGLKADKERIRKNVEQSLMIVTALVPEIGYDKASEIAKKAHAEGKTIREVAGEMLKMSESKLDQLLDPKRLV